MATAPKISYVARDFSSNKQALIDYIREQFPQDWTDFFDSNLGVALLELASYDFTILSYMLDKQANESYLPTAMLRENVIKLLNLIDYNLTPATAASVDVDAWLSAAIGSDTTIPAGTRATSADGLTFEVDQDYTIPAGSVTPLEVIVPAGTGATFTAGSYVVTFATELSALVFPGMHIKGLGAHQNVYRIASVSSDRLSLELTTVWNQNGISEVGVGYYVENQMITLSEGETRSQNFASDGTVGQRFQGSFGPVISGSIVVTVDNVVWTEIDNLVYSAGGNDYELDYDAFDKVTVIFGDGISGAIPVLGADIKVVYRIGGGTVGNLAIAGINTSVSGYFGISQVVQVFLANTVTRGSGGADRETIEHARLYNPLSVKTNDRAVTAEDYMALASTFSSPLYGTVAKAIAILKENLVPKTMNLIYVYVWVLSTGNAFGPPSAGLRNALLTYLNTKKIITDEVLILDGINKSVDVMANIKYDPTYDAAVVKAAVLEALDVVFLDPTRAPGDTLHISKLYEAIEAVDGVNYVIITSPTGDVTTNVNEMISKGTVTLTAIV